MEKVPMKKEPLVIASHFLSQEKSARGGIEKEGPEEKAPAGTRF